MLTEHQNCKDGLPHIKTDKTIVMACSHPYWSSLQVGSQHIARQFARHGWQVHYFSAPISPLHLPKLFAPEVISRFKGSCRNPTLHENGKIHSYIPFSLLAPDGRPLLRSRPVIHNWYKTMLPPLKQLLARSNVGRVDLLYIDNLSYHFLLDVIHYAKSVFRVMDMHERFPGWRGEARRLAKKNATRSDLTIYSAQGLKAYVEALAPPKSLFVPNGVDFEAFEATKTRLSRPACLSCVPDPILLYTGMIDARLDFDAIRTVAHRLPQISFVFAGPPDQSRIPLDLPPNVYFTGPVCHAELPSLMQAAVAGLIPFDVNSRLDAIRGIRPLKLFEYMAAGLPVISARWPEIEDIQSPAWFYDDTGQFVELAYKAVKKEFDPEIARSFAEQFDWKYAFERLVLNLDCG